MHHDPLILTKTKSEQLQELKWNRVKRGVTIESAQQPTTPTPTINQFKALSVPTQCIVQLPVIMEQQQRAPKEDYSRVPAVKTNRGDTTMITIQSSTIKMHIKLQ